MPAKCLGEQVSLAGNFPSPAAVIRNGVAKPQDCRGAAQLIRLSTIAENLGNPCWYSRRSNGPAWPHRGAKPRANPHGGHDLRRYSCRYAELARALRLLSFIQPSDLTSHGRGDYRVETAFFFAAELFGRFSPRVNSGKGGGLNIPFTPPLYSGGRRPRSREENFASSSQCVTLA